MNNIKNLTLATAAALAICSTPSAMAAEQTWTGQISDSMCVTKHTMGEHDKKLTTDRDCAQACASHGAEYVLVTDGKVYKLRNHDADLKTHAGHTVSLTGELKDDTIRVSKVEMANTEKP